jgi:hypothetical protein
MNMMQHIWNEKGSTKTIVLVVVFVILLVATFAQRKKVQKIEEAEKAATQVSLVELNTEAVYSIEIFELMSKTVLQKREGKWWVGSTQIMPNWGKDEKTAAEIKAWDYADEEAIKQVLEMVHEGLKNWELVSVNSEKKIEYRVGALGSKFTFKNEKGEVLTCIDVGEKSADYTGTYVSKCDENEVYKIPGILEQFFKKDVSGWRSKQVFEIDKEKIKSLEILDSATGKPVTITKGATGEWTGVTPSAFAPDKKKVDALLTSFSTFKGSGFPDRRMSPEEPTISEIQLTVTATMDNGEALKLEFGKGEGMPQEILVRGNQKPFIYTASQEDIDKFNLTVEYLTTPEEETPAESGVPGDPNASPIPGQ